LLIAVLAVTLLAFVPVQAGAADTGSISGQVLNTADNPHSNTCVDAYDTDSFDSGSAQSDSNGNFSIIGLEPGEYFVAFSRCDSSENVAREYYPDKGSRAEATPVQVTAGADTPGIDGQLERGVSISGTVTGNGPTFAPYLCFGGVSALDVGGDLVETDDFPEISSASMPGYPIKFKVEKLKPGSSYRLKASIYCGWMPVTETYDRTEFFRDQASLAAAAPISVGMGSAITGIDINFDSPDPEITAPDTIIDSGPTGKITTDEATYAFSSSEPANTAGFECKLDSGEFSDCSSPMTFTSLSEGRHSVAFRAEHAVVGNQDQSPATRTFRVDTDGSPNPKAWISAVVVKGPSKLKLGNEATFGVRVTNSGKDRATGVRLRVIGMGASAISPVGSIPARSAKTLKLKLKPERGGRGQLTFKVSSGNAGSKSAKRRITVSKR
jgi:hypothetical protein